MLGPVAELLDCWFGELTDGFADTVHRERWFRSDAAFDAQLRSTFGSLPDQAASGALKDWLDEPHSCLAYVLATDQLPRNMHRGSDQAFAYDALALAGARQAIVAGFDRALQLDERSFLYLPFEHSEHLIDQHTAVGLFTQLRDETPSGLKHITGNTLRYAHEHRDIIQRFGRFPHRNAVLGRDTTEAESAFAQGGGFGQ